MAAVSLVDVFKEVFKRFKKSVDFSEVLDFTCPDQLSRFKVWTFTMVYMSNKKIVNYSKRWS